MLASGVWRNPRDGNLEQPLNTSCNRTALCFYMGGEDLAANIPRERFKGDTEGKSKYVNHKDRDYYIRRKLACFGFVFSGCWHATDTSQNKH